MATAQTNSFAPTDKAFWDRDQKAISGDLSRSATFRGLSPDEQQKLIGGVRTQFGIVDPAPPTKPGMLADVGHQLKRGVHELLLPTEHIGGNIAEAIAKHPGFTVGDPNQTLSAKAARAIRSDETRVKDWLAADERSNGAPVTTAGRVTQGITQGGGKLLPYLLGPEGAIGAATVGGLENLDQGPQSAVGGAIEAGIGAKVAGKFARGGAKLLENIPGASKLPAYAKRALAAGLTGGALGSASGDPSQIASNAILYGGLGAAQPEPPVKRPIEAPVAVPEEAPAPPMKQVGAARGPAGLLGPAKTAQPIDVFTKATGLPIEHISELADMDEFTLRSRQQYLTRLLKSETSPVPDIAGKGASRARSIEDRQHLTRELQAVDLLLADKEQMAGRAMKPGQNVTPEPPPPDQRSPFEMPGMVRPEIQKALPPASGNSLPAPPQGQLGPAPPTPEAPPAPPEAQQAKPEVYVPEVPPEEVEPAPPPPTKKKRVAKEKAKKKDDGMAAAPVATVPPPGSPPGGGATAVAEPPVQTKTADDGAVTRGSSLTRLSDRSNP